MAQLTTGGTNLSCKPWCRLPKDNTLSTQWRVFVDYAPDVGVVLIDKFIQSRGRVPQQREVKKVGAESVDVDCFYRAESDGLERTM